MPSSILTVVEAITIRSTPSARHVAAPPMVSRSTADSVPAR